MVRIMVLKSDEANTPHITKTRRSGVLFKVVGTVLKYILPAWFLSRWGLPRLEARGDYNRVKVGRGSLLCFQKNSKVVD